MTRRPFIATLFALMALTSLPALALDKPAGDTVLLVTGKVSQTNSPSGAAFDMNMLARLPQYSFTTKTPWYPTARKFTGPRLRDVLAAAGAQGQTLQALALNDYKTDIPAEDARRFDVIVARLMDDKPMPRRDKGPLFIIYPFDTSEALRSELYYNRSAWQLKTINVQ